MRSSRIDAIIIKKSNRWQTYEKNSCYDTLSEGLFNDSAHPNRYGQQVMGEALQKWLEDNMESVLG